MKGEQLERTLHEVLLQGYRNIDTAPEYENEQNIAKLVQTWYGNITRRLLFITTKVYFCVITYNIHTHTL